MGKIINILGPHGVGKTTLQNYILDNSIGIVSEGFILSTKGFNLNNPDEYFEYEKRYLQPINEQNKAIANSFQNGFVIRSIEEIEYFLKTHVPAVPEAKIEELKKRNENIFCDLLIYLDSTKEELDKRIEQDKIRDLTETSQWYKDDFEKYDKYWKNHRNIHVIDTTNLSVAEVFQKINFKLKEINMDRYIKAQEEIYENVVSELKLEKKVSHWMWYIFPQLQFLGKSRRAIFYGLIDAEEAKIYCQNHILHSRYLECCKILLETGKTNPEDIFGPIDAIKLNSSLTLFYCIDEQNRQLYERLIHKFYNGKMDQATIDFLK